MNEPVIYKQLERDMWIKEIEAYNMVAKVEATHKESMYIVMIISVTV